MYFFYNYDIRGSVTNIINPDGQIVKGYDYDEFGGTKEKGDYAFKNDVKFTGAVHDKSANLYYMNARFYNPNTGRFITEDTYSGNAYEPWTQHLYTYTSNNPVNFIDPTGHRAMYAMNPEDETDVQRSTSLNQMKGYSAKDSYKIATAKTPKKKQKAIKMAQENKAKKANEVSISNQSVSSTSNNVEYDLKGSGNTLIAGTLFSIGENIATEATLGHVTIPYGKMPIPIKLSTFETTGRFFKVAGIYSLMFSIQDNFVGGYSTKEAWIRTGIDILAFAGTVAFCAGGGWAAVGIGIGIGLVAEVSKYGISKLPSVRKQ